MSSWETRKQFLFLTEADEATLTLLKPLMARHVDELVDAFYRHLLMFEETRRLLTDNQLVARLKEAQKHYLLSLVSGPYDETYREGRLQIGYVHERIGLTPQWYLGAYALYFNLIRPYIFQEFHTRPDQLQNILGALTKVIFLDTQLTIEAYIQRGAERVEFANQQLAAFSRELEQELMRQKRELSQTQEQLRATERVAEIGTLASSMAHEIGTPLNVILGRAEFLLRRAGDETMQYGLKAIIAQSERITKIMNHTLSFARRKPVERRLTHLGQTIKDSLDWISDRIRRRSVQIDTALREPVPPVLANPDQLNQVLLNLMLNALDAMPKGGTLRIVLDHDGTHVKLVVSDTGCGIPKESLSQVFEPFFTTKEAGQGTGLGLAIVRNLVQDHRGSITVESDQGRGTTFTILLPIPPDNEVPASSVPPLLVV